MNALTETWIEIGAAGDIPPRGAHVVRTPQGCIATFRSADGCFFALDDRCPHRGGPLSQGIVHGRGVTCPLHNWVIGLESGAARGPDEGRVRTWRLRVENGRLLLDPAALTTSRSD